MQRGPKGTFVYVVNNDTAKMREVTISKQDEQQAVVSKGLNENEQVITTGFARLTDNGKIQVENSDGSTPQTPPTGQRGQNRRQR